MQCLYQANILSCIIFVFTWFHVNQNIAEILEIACPQFDFSYVLTVLLSDRFSTFLVKLRQFHPIPAQKSNLV